MRTEAVDDGSPFRFATDVGVFALTPVGARSVVPELNARQISMAGLRRYGELLRMLSSRTLRTRYRGSVLGVFWSLSNPLLMTGVYTVIFGTAFASYYDNSIFNYIFATFVGLAILNIFSQTTAQALTSVVSNGGLLNKVSVPVSLFPIACVSSNFFQFCVGPLPLLLAITAYKTHSLVNVIALLIPTLALLFSTIGFSLLTSALYVYFRDLPYMWEMAMFVIWVTSPIFYPLALVPVKIQPYLAFNPLIFTVGSLRQIALVPGLPDLQLAGKSLLGGFVCLVIGSAVFAFRKRDFMDLL